MEKTRGDGYKLHLGRIQLDTKGNTFPIRTISIGIISPGSGGFPNTGHCEDSAGQGGGTSNALPRNVGPDPLGPFQPGVL